MRPPPFLGVPYPMLDYALGELAGDYGKIMLRVAQLARATPSTVDGIALDIGESLVDERSDRIWGGLRLDREVSPEGRRALVRRVLERLERDGWISRRAARAGGPGNDPRTGPRNGPSPTVVRFLRYREILWPACAAPAQETAQDSAQEAAPASGPIPPAKPPDPPGTHEKPSRAPAARRSDGVGTPQGKALDHWNATVWPKLSTAVPPKPSVGAMTMLARRCKAHGVAEVMAAMDRAREKLEHGDAWLSENLTLQVFLGDSQFPKFLPRATTVRVKGAPVPAMAEGFGKGGGF